MKFLVFFLLNIILPLSFADPKISIDPTTINNLVLALKEIFSLNDIQLERMPFSPTQSYFVLK